MRKAKRQILEVTVLLLVDASNLCVTLMSLSISLGPEYRLLAASQRLADASEKTGEVVIYCALAWCGQNSYK